MNRCLSYTYMHFSFIFFLPRKLLTRAIIKLSVCLLAPLSLNSPFPNCGFYLCVPSLPDHSPNPWTNLKSSFFQPMFKGRFFSHVAIRHKEFLCSFIFLPLTE